MGDSSEWHDYISHPPPRDLLCRFRQPCLAYGMVDETRPYEWTGYPRDLDPESNCAYLKWKLTGIAREELDRMSPTVRAQILSPAQGSYLVNALWGNVDGFGMFALGTSALGRASIDYNAYCNSGHSGLDRR